MIATVLAVLFRRLFGRKKFSSWSLSTELVWATTRLTLTSSNRYGLPWLQNLSTKFIPKPKLGDAVSITKESFLDHYYLKVEPKNLDFGATRTILYFHGGGFTIGSPEASLEFTSRLALETQAELIVPHYPLAPKYAYPAAHQYALALVEEFTQTTGKPLFLAGDSAGAALVLASFTKLSTAQQKRIRGTILISPWVKPLADGGSIVSNSRNDVGDREFVVAC